MAKVIEFFGGLKAAMTKRGYNSNEIISSVEYYRGIMKKASPAMCDKMRAELEKHYGFSSETIVLSPEKVKKDNNWC